MARFRTLVKRVMALLPAEDKDFVFPEEKFRFYPITDKGHLTAVVLSPLGRVKTRYDDNSDIFQVPGRLEIEHCSATCCPQGTRKIIDLVNGQILDAIDNRARYVWPGLFPNFKASLPIQIRQCGIVQRKQVREHAVLLSTARYVTPNHVRGVLEHPQDLVIVVKLVLEGEYSDPFNPPRPPHEEGDPNRDASGPLPMPRVPFRSFIN
ncbi:hypothetical protein F5Y18DRAFT_436436 [Xylariaceae sp. FL1019]|nr:hypothetical protein F5Y18DRAFT_436436 [Xylariaceae sp. FL1019]